ncbi:MAG: RNA polymerase sigma factor [candidate division Zixibacteria bacterium]|nr:RNA polymerase sigma factor [candidate division Zixibacteria bacterium]MDD5426411.1 RNA polymerase sigma factor [candidate division Zixibacteria bacterium]
MKNDLFWTWLEPLHEPAIIFCRRLTGNRDEGDDLYQEALVTAIGKILTLRDPERFKPWLYRIMVNSYKNRLRRPWIKRRAMVSDGLLTSQKTDDPTECITARRWLERAFRELRPEEKALIVLFEIEGWTITELAELEDKPEGTIKARLSRARKKMRRAILKYTGEVENRTMPKGGRVCVAMKPDAE